MAGSNRRYENSLETILTYENRDASQWSVVWSTMHIPGMDNAAGAGGRRPTGRRRLRMGSLALGALLTMHCRVSSSILTGGFLFFMMCLIAAVLLLANPLRHFEVYLGQWSISGPGRAFRIIPMFDGIGIAMCINAVVRAITCCAMAAIALVYVLHSAADAKLPFTYCRDSELKAYDPELKYINSLRVLPGTRYLVDGPDVIFEEEKTLPSITVGLKYTAWRNASYSATFRNKKRVPNNDYPRQIEVCKETYKGKYPPFYRTPAYNFFYVEVVHLRSDYSLKQFNSTLLASIIFTWLIIWLLLVMERLTYGRLVWNNIHSWIMILPCIWVAVLAVTAASNLTSFLNPIVRLMQISPMEVFASVADAFEVALYIHSSSVGTELIHGKGLNHYASGHIDPNLNNENVWHSGNILLLTGLHACGAALCTLSDHMHSNITEAYKVSTFIFGGLAFSYTATAFLLLKTALHTIFEYRVKLVFVEQAVVGCLILTCMTISVFIATNGGLPLLESVDSVMTGVAMPLVCALELVGLLYVYRSCDFISDMNVATEDNNCSTRISTQWQIIPAITVATLILKLTVIVNAEMPSRFMYIALAPLLGVIMAVPLRACHNAYTFLRQPHHGA